MTNRDRMATTHRNTNPLFRDQATEYLAWSVDRTVSLASGMFAVGPRGGRKRRFAVRLGIGEDGVAKGGCCLFERREDAEACFLRHAPGNDVLVEAGARGSIVLVTPLTDRAREWIAENVSGETTWLGDALAVEPRYAYDLVDGMRAELRVEVT